MYDPTAFNISDRDLERLADMVAERVARLIGTPRLKEVMDSNECAAYLGITPGRLRAIVAEGNVPHSKGPNKKNYYRRSEIDEWRAGKKVICKAQAEAVAERLAVKRKYSL